MKNKNKFFLPNPESYLFYDYTKYYKNFNNRSVFQGIVKYFISMLTALSYIIN